MDGHGELGVGPLTDHTGEVACCVVRRLDGSCLVDEDISRRYWWLLEAVVAKGVVRVQAINVLGLEMVPCGRPVPDRAKRNRWQRCGGGG